MYCRFTELWENGMLLPNYRVARNPSQWFEGDFTLQPIDHKVFRRTMKRAQMTKPIEAGGDGQPVRPYLWDACIVAMERDWMRVSGFYYDDHSRISMAQTWHIHILAQNYQEWVSISVAEAARKYEIEMKQKAAEKK
jgi:hypothetical protein